MFLNAFDVFNFHFSWRMQYLVHLQHSLAQPFPHFMRVGSLSLWRIAALHFTSVGLLSCDPGGVLQEVL
jgi:hypothetical protein